MILKTLVEPFALQIAVFKFSHTEVGDIPSLYVSYFNKDYYSLLTVVQIKCKW